MTASTKTALKALFQTGDTLAEGSFVDLIDSLFDLAETGQQTVTGPITFSNAVTFSSAVTFTTGTLIPVTAGGTGLSSVSAYAIMVGNNTAAISLISPNSTSGVPLISQGVSANPAYGTAVVAGGGTGVATVSAYTILCGGTTNTGAFQNVSTEGTSGQVLTSNGAGALPTWQNAQAGILSSVYPIGSYYFNETDSTNPATLFGFGTWVAVTDKFIVGHGSTYTTTGGAATVTLVEGNLPSSVTLDQTSVGDVNNSSTGSVKIAASQSGARSLSYAVSLGSDTPFSIIPPYQAAYIWKRTA